MELPVVAVWEIDAEVGAAAFGARECGLQDGLGHDGECARLNEAAAVAGLCDFVQRCGVAGVCGESGAEGLFGAQEAGVGPHVALDRRDKRGHAGFCWGGQGIRGWCRFGHAGWGEGVFSHGAAGAGAEDEAFQKRIGGQAIGAVDAGAGDFAGGVEAGDGGAAVEVGLDAAHQVMRGGAHGDEIVCKVEMVLSEEGADAGKTLVQVYAGYMAHVEVDRARFGVWAGWHAFAGDGAGNNVARGEFG